MNTPESATFSPSPRQREQAERLAAEREPPDSDRTKQIAAELWVIFAKWHCLQNVTYADVRSDGRERFEAAIERLLGTTAEEARAATPYPAMLRDLRESLRKDAEQRAKAHDYAGAIAALKASEAVWQLEQMDGVKYFVPF